MSTISLQQAINRIKARQLSVSELREFLTHPSPVVRANAVEVFAEHILEHEELDLAETGTFLIILVKNNQECPNTVQP